MRRDPEVERMAARKLCVAHDSAIFFSRHVERDKIWPARVYILIKSMHAIPICRLAIFMLWNSADFNGTRESFA